MVLRAIIIYIAALVMVRIGQKRFLGRNTAFDLILGIILGSVVSRAINGSGEFFPTIASGFALVFLHWFFAALAFRYDRFGNLVKGRPRTLIEEGNIVWDAMRKSNISRTDLNTALRLELNQDDLDGGPAGASGAQRRYQLCHRRIVPPRDRGRGRPGHADYSHPPGVMARALTCPSRERACIWSSWPMRAPLTWPISKPPNTLM